MKATRLTATPSVALSASPGMPVRHGRLLCNLCAFNVRFAFQHGKDFEAIQNNIALKYKKKGKPASMVKNKEQVRHFYYRTWHKITKYIDFDNGEGARLLGGRGARRLLAGAGFQPTRHTPPPALSLRGRAAGGFRALWCCGCWWPGDHRPVRWNVLLMLWVCVLHRAGSSPRWMRRGRPRVQPGLSPVVAPWAGGRAGPGGGGLALPRLMSGFEAGLRKPCLQFTHPDRCLVWV